MMNNRRQKRERNNSSISGYTYIVHMGLRCTTESSEFVLMSKEQTDVTIENMVVQVLQKHFDTVLVDKISMRWSSPPTTFPAFSILINAHCYHQHPASTAQLERLEYTFEHTIGIICGELFTTVYVERVVVKVLPTEEWVRILSIH